MKTGKTTILVTGVTGQQGGAVARHLLGTEFEVRGLTRNPEKPEAKALASNGVEIVAGDLDDRPSVDRALKGCYGVFSVQNFMETGAEREVRQGVDLTNAARAAGIEHLVYSSVGAANRATGLPHFESKWQIEQHIRSLGVPYSILRPVFFMQNWSTYFKEDIRSGILRQPLAPDARLQQVSVDDIGGIAALAFSKPGRWIGREVDLAGDDLSMLEVTETLSRVLGTPITYVRTPWEQFRQVAGEEITRMYKWFEEVGFAVNIAALRSEYRHLARLEQVVKSENWREWVTRESRKAA